MSKERKMLDDIIKKADQNFVQFPLTEQGLADAKKMVDEEKITGEFVGYTPLRLMVDYKTMHQLLKVHGLTEEEITEQVIKFATDIIRKELRMHFAEQAKKG